MIIQRKKGLIITQNQNLSHKIYDSLSDIHLDFHYAETCAHMLSLYSRFHYVLVILDLHISDVSGVAIVRRLRQLEQSPILALSASYSRLEEIEALNAGADAYLPMDEPLDQELLLAHASALMRRYLSANTRQAALIQIAKFGLKINCGTRKAFLNGENLHLTPKQFDILQLLVDRIGEVVTKEELLEHVWKENYDICADASLKFQVKELRKKLCFHGATDVIETIWSIGYLLCLEDDDHTPE